LTVLLLLLSFALILGGAVLFTNAVEWLGKRLGFGHGAVGSLLAAVGTALPESLIPIVALVGGDESGEDVAIGAIIGAPFMLATVAMVLVGGSALVFAKRRKTGRAINADPALVRRDLGAFLLLFTVALLLGLGAPQGLRIAGGIVLFAAYLLYAYLTVRGGGSPAHDDELSPLTFDPTKDDPPTTFQIALQVLVGLGLIVAGAELFVEELVHIAEALGIGALALALVLAPLATELPEKANSVFWMRQSKDSLAVGNITGAMVFQSTVPVSVGLLFTEWTLSRYALAGGVLALAGGALAYVALRRGRVNAPFVIIWLALFASFVAFVALG
jgi:cation:H+ antiporter